VEKLFELETSVRKASQQLELAYNTTYGLYDLIRQIILPLTKEKKRFKERLKLMKVPLEGGEKANVARVLPTRSQYSESWNGGVSSTRTYSDHTTVW